ncbi:hypothetical protein AAMO2058_000345700 [Amorphochlora amoebiformis]
MASLRVLELIEALSPNLSSNKGTTALREHWKNLMSRIKEASLPAELSADLEHILKLAVRAWPNLVSCEDVNEDDRGHLSNFDKTVTQTTSPMRRSRSSRRRVSVLDFVMTRSPKIADLEFLELKLYAVLYRNPDEFFAFQGFNAKVLSSFPLKKHVSPHLSSGTVLFWARHFGVRKSVSSIALSLALYMHLSSEYRLNNMSCNPPPPCILENMLSSLHPVRTTLSDTREMREGDDKCLFMMNLTKKRVYLSLTQWLEMCNMFHSLSVKWTAKRMVKNMSQVVDEQGRRYHWLCLSDISQAELQSVRKRKKLYCAVSLSLRGASLVVRSPVASTKLDMGEIVDLREENLRTALGQWFKTALSLQQDSQEVDKTFLRRNVLHLWDIVKKHGKFFDQFFIADDEKKSGLVCPGRLRKYHSVPSAIGSAQTSTVLEEERLAAAPLGAGGQKSSRGSHISLASSTDVMGQMNDYKMDPLDTSIQSEKMNAIRKLEEVFVLRNDVVRAKMVLTNSSMSHNKLQHVIRTLMQKKKDDERSVKRAKMEVDNLEKRMRLLERAMVEIEDRSVSTVNELKKIEANKGSLLRKGLEDTSTQIVVSNAIGMWEKAKKLRKEHKLLSDQLDAAQKKRLYSPRLTTSSAEIEMKEISSSSPNSTSVIYSPDRKVRSLRQKMTMTEFEWRKLFKTVEKDELLSPGSALESQMSTEKMLKTENGIQALKLSKEAKGLEYVLQQTSQDVQQKQIIHEKQRQTAVDLVAKIGKLNQRIEKRADFISFKRKQLFQISEIVRKATAVSNTMQMAFDSKLKECHDILGTLFIQCRSAFHLSEEEYLQAEEAFMALINLDLRHHSDLGFRKFEACRARGDEFNRVMLPLINCDLIDQYDHNYKSTTFVHDVATFALNHRSWLICLVKISTIYPQSLLRHRNNWVSLVRRSRLNASAIQDLKDSPMVRAIFRYSASLQQDKTAVYEPGVQISGKSKNLRELIMVMICMCSTKDDRNTLFAQILMSAAVCDCPEVFQWVSNMASPATMLLLWEEFKSLVLFFIEKAPRDAFLGMDEKVSSKQAPLQEDLSNMIVELEGKFLIPSENDTKQVFSRMFQSRRDLPSDSEVLVLNAKTKTWERGFVRKRMMNRKALRLTLEVYLASDPSNIMEISPFDRSVLRLNSPQHENKLEPCRNSQMEIKEDRVSFGGRYGGSLSEASSLASQSQWRHSLERFRNRESSSMGWIVDIHKLRTESRTNRYYRDDGKNQRRRRAYVSGESCVRTHITQEEFELICPIELDRSWIEYEEFKKDPKKWPWPSILHLLVDSGGTSSRYPAPIVRRILSWDAGYFAGKRVRIHKRSRMLKMMDREKRIPMMLALKNHNRNIFQILFEESHTSYMHHRDINGDSLLHYLVKSPVFSAAEIFSHGNGRESIITIKESDIRTIKIWVEKQHGKRFNIPDQTICDASPSAKKLGLVLGGSLLRVNGAAPTLKDHNIGTYEVVFPPGAKKYSLFMLYPDGYYVRSMCEKVEAVDGESFEETLGRIANIENQNRISKKSLAVSAKRKPKRHLLKNVQNSEKSRENKMLDVGKIKLLDSAFFKRLAYLLIKMRNIEGLNPLEAFLAEYQGQVKTKHFQSYVTTATIEDGNKKLTYTQWRRSHVWDKIVVMLERGANLSLWVTDEAVPRENKNIKRIRENHLKAKQNLSDVLFEMMRYDAGSPIPDRGEVTASITRFVSTLNDMKNSRQSHVRRRREPKFYHSQKDLQFCIPQFTERMVGSQYVRNVKSKSSGPNFRMKNCRLSYSWRTLCSAVQAGNVRLVKLVTTGRFAQWQLPQLSQGNASLLHLACDGYFCIRRSVDIVRHILDYNAMRKRNLVEGMFHPANENALGQTTSSLAASPNKNSPDLSLNLDMVHKGEVRVPMHLSAKHMQMLYETALHSFSTYRGALHYASSSLHTDLGVGGDSFEIIRLLLRRQAKMGRYDAFAMSELHYAVLSKDLQIINELTNYTDLNLPTKPSKPTIWRTTMNKSGFLERQGIVDLQVNEEYSAPVTTKRSQVDAPGMMFLPYPPSSVYRSAGDKSTTVEVPIYSRQCRYLHGGETGLHLAASNGLVDVATMLLKKGAQIDATDRRGLTPLGSAMMRFKDLKTFFDLMPPTDWENSVSCAPTSHSRRRKFAFAVCPNVRSALTELKNDLDIVIQLLIREGADLDLAQRFSSTTFEEVYDIPSKFREIVEQEKVFAKAGKSSDDARKVRSIEDSVKNIFNDRMNQIVCDAVYRMEIRGALTWRCLRYIFFLTLLSFVVVNLATRDRREAFLFHNALYQTLVEDEIPYAVSHLKRNFKDIDQIEEFWMWLKGPFIDQFYPLTAPSYADANGQEVTLRGYLGGTSRIIGVPRLRQLRSTSTACEVPSKVLVDGEKCFSQVGCTIPNIGCTQGIFRGNQVFSGSNTESLSYNYKSPEDLDTYGTLDWGQYNRWYPIGGHVQSFPTPWSNDSHVNATALIASLEAANWIDMATRVVMLEFALVNTHKNDYCVASMMIEFPVVGGTVQSFDFHIGRFIHYLDGEVDMVLEIVLSICFFMYMLGELESLSLLGTCKYLSQSSNLLMGMMVFIWLVLIGVYIANHTLESQINWGEQIEFVALERLSWGVRATTVLMSALIAMGWWQLMNHLCIFKAFSELLIMIEFMLIALVPLLFCLVFMLASFAFAEYVAFGYQDAASQNVWLSFYSRMVETFDGINYNQTVTFDRVMGTFWSLVFVVFLGVLFLNLIIAVLTHQYESAREQIGRRHWAHHQYKTIIFFWILQKDRRDRFRRWWQFCCGCENSDDDNLDDSPLTPRVSLLKDPAEHSGCCGAFYRQSISCQKRANNMLKSLTNSFKKLCIKCYNCWVIPAAKRHMEHISALEIDANLSRLQDQVLHDRGIEFSMHRLPSMRERDRDPRLCDCARSCYEMRQWCKHICRNCCDFQDGKFVQDMDEQEESPRDQSKSG